MLGSPQLGFQRAGAPRGGTATHPHRAVQAAFHYSEIKQGPHEVGLRAVDSFAESGTEKVQWCLAEPSAGGDTEVSPIYPSKIWGQTLPELCH